MARRRVIALTTWAVATAAAVALSWLAVSYAVADVADPIPKAIAHGTKDAPAELAPALDVTRSSAIDAAVSATTTTEPAAPSPTTAPATIPTPGPSPQASTIPASGPVESQPAPGTGVASTPPPTTAPPSPPPGATASFGSPGGTITVRCAGTTISLVSATPQSGYRTQVSDSGPQEVEVHFVSSTREYEIHAVCQNGQPVAGAVDD